MLIGAVTRSVQSAGALETILALSVRYANERVAFGRPSENSRPSSAAPRGLPERLRQPWLLPAGRRSPSRTPDASMRGVLEAASGRSGSTEAAEAGAASPHQVHGAMGFPSEQVLHRFASGLLPWRGDFGDECHWALQLGSMMAARGAEEFWPLVASR